MEDELQWLQDRLLTGAYPVGYGVRVALLPLFSTRQVSSAPIRIGRAMVAHVVVTHVP